MQNSPLGWIIANHTVDHDLLFALIEPAILSAHWAGCLCRRGRKIEIRCDADQAGQQAFEGEKPAPALQSIVTAKAENAVSKECCDNLGTLICHPGAVSIGNMVISILHTRRNSGVVEAQYLCTSTRGRESCQE